MAGVELDRCATVQEMSNQLSSKPDLPQHKLDRFGESWSLPTTSQLHLFCTTWSLLRTIFNPASWWLSPSYDSYAAAFCCRDVGLHGPNNKHGLEEHLWRIGSATSTVASLRVARLWLGWLPSQARLPLHDGQHRTWQMCHCSLNVKSTLIKVALPQHKPGSPWGKLVATYNFAASPFLHYMISTQDHFQPC